MNSITVKYPYPLPLVPAALKQLRSAKIFITNVLTKFLGKFIVTYAVSNKYIDDILIYSPDYESQINYVKKVLVKLYVNQLYVEKM